MYANLKNNKMFVINGVYSSGNFVMKFRYNIIYVYCEGDENHQETINYCMHNGVEILALRRNL